MTENTIFDAGNVQGANVEYKYSPADNTPAGGTNTLTINVTAFEGDPAVQMLMFNPANKDEYWAASDLRTIDSTGEVTLEWGPHTGETYVRYMILVDSDDSVTFTSFTGTASVPPAAMAITSSDFAEGEAMDLMNGCTAQGGSDHSPQLSFANVPEAAVELAVIMDDETAPCGAGTSACAHWGVFDLPSDTASIDHNATGLTATSLAYNGIAGYQGACPPNGEHTYKTTVYALSSDVDATTFTGSNASVMTRALFEASYADHILSHATITSTFTTQATTPAVTAITIPSDITNGNGPDTTLGTDDDPTVKGSYVSGDLTFTRPPLGGEAPFADWCDSDTSTAEMGPAASECTSSNTAASSKPWVGGNVFFRRMPYKSAEAWCASKNGRLPTRAEITEHLLPIGSGGVFQETMTAPDATNAGWPQQQSKYWTSDVHNGNEAKRTTFTPRAYAASGEAAIPGNHFNNSADVNNPAVVASRLWVMCVGATASD